MKLHKAKTTVAGQAGEALLRQLPVETKTLKRIAKWLEPGHLKQVGLLAVGVSFGLSALNSLGEARMVRAAVSRELKKQLVPVNKKLDELEAQNRELKRENEELLKLCREKN